MAQGLKIWVAMQRAGGAFYFAKCPHASALPDVKTVQIEWFIIEINISKFKKSFAKMWKLTEKIPGFTYWKSVFLDIFCSAQIVPPDIPEFFLWGPGPDSSWSFINGFGCNGVHRWKFKFLKDFLY